MKRVFQFISLFAFSTLGTSLVGDEPRVRKQPAGDSIEQLGDKDPAKVCAAARTLGKLGAARDAVPALKELLKNRNGRVKWTAAEALWLLEHKAADLVPVYAELLTAAEADVRAASAWRLGRFGSDARPAVLMLAGTLRDESFEVRVQAGQALANLGAFAEPALPALVRALGDSQLDESGQVNDREESARKSPALPALVELADDSIPLLIGTFRKNAARHRPEDPPDRRGWEAAKRVAFAFPGFGGRALAPLLQALDSKDADTRRYAALALREMAELNGLPANAIDKLEKCLDDPNNRVCSIAASAMSWVRPSSTKAVTMRVKAREDLEISNSELFADLERMCPHNEEARKLLFRLLEDKDAETAQEAHRILAGLELPADRVLGVWTKALSHANSKVRSEALYALMKLGPNAKTAKSALHERFTKEKDSGILFALIRIDPDDPALLPWLLRSMDAGDRSFSLSAIRSLADLGPRAKDAMPRIEACLLNLGKGKTDDFYDGLSAHDLVIATVRIAPDSAKSATTLLKALRRQGIRDMHCPKNTWYMRDVLEDALQANLPAGELVLREALKDEDTAVRQSAALVLLRAGLEIETALPVLMDKLWSGTDTHEEQSRFQGRVVELLSRRRHPTAQAVAAAWCKAWQAGKPNVREILESGLLVLQSESLPHLLDQLRQAKTPQARRDLAHLLAHFEGQSKQVVPILREELLESHPVAQCAAVRALMTLGTDAAEAVPELLRLLSNPHPGMRALAAQALGSIGRAARPAVPALKAMLKETQSDLRIIAANALSQIDPDVSEALTLLRDVLASEKNEGAIHFRHDRIELPEGVKDRAIYPDSIEEGIVRFGERAVTVLADLLDNVDLDEWSAENISAQCGANARIQAALLLAKLGPEAKTAVPALIRALKDRDPFVRDAAASALGRIGPAAKQAAPDFITLLEQQNRVESAAGTWSPSPRATGRFRAASRYDYGGPFDFRSAGRGGLLSRDVGFGYYGESDPYADIRPTYPYDPAYVLGRIDSETRSAQPILSEMAKDPNHPRRLSAALALWRSGCDAPDLIPAFTAALEAHARIAKNETVPLTREMRECLAELDTQLKPTDRVMAEWLKQRGAFAELVDQVAVVELLGRLGPDARAESDVIRPMLQGDRWDSKRRVAAALALFRIRGEKDLVFPVLREVLVGLEEHSSLYYRPDQTDTARVHAARALGVLAENGGEHAKALIIETAKGDENPFVRVAALEVMARQKPSNAAAMRGLCALLRHTDATVRFEAASACGRLGPRAKLGLKALQVATEDSQLAVRQAARQALDLLD